MGEKPQIININIDDSGKLVQDEQVTIYAGITFLSKKEKDKFITQYKNIVAGIKCKYCKLDNVNCNNAACPELKHNMLKAKHIRQIINYVKKYSILACIISNEQVYSHIKEDKATRGRYLDFALKLLIKNIIQKLIKNKLIDPNKPVKLILNIDEQTTKSNGYYNLKDSIYEELKYGIFNYNYNIKYKPVLCDTLNIELSYKDSKNSYLIQASDLIAGTVRKLYLKNINNIAEFNKYTDFIDYKIFLP